MDYGSAYGAVPNQNYENIESFNSLASEQQNIVKNGDSGQPPYGKKVGAI